MYRRQQLSDGKPGEFCYCGTHVRHLGFQQHSGLHRLEKQVREYAVVNYGDAAQPTGYGANATVAVSVRRS